MSNTNKPNPYRNTRIEFHILQSFPVSCLNRDDVGAPKSAMIGGVLRARVSSQCWKRAIRMAMRDLGVEIATRTRYVVSVISEACAAVGAAPENAEACGEAIAKALTKTVKDGLSDTLFFISGAEAAAIAGFYKDNAFDTSVDAKAFLKSLKVNTDKDGIDIALFGRMAASAPEMNIEAARRSHTPFRRTALCPKSSSSQRLTTAPPETRPGPGTWVRSSSTRRFITVIFPSIWGNCTKT